MRIHKKTWELFLTKLQCILLFIKETFSLVSNILFESLELSPAPLPNFIPEYHPSFPTSCTEYLLRAIAIVRKTCRRTMVICPHIIKYIWHKVRILCLYCLSYIQVPIYIQHTVDLSIIHPVSYNLVLCLHCK